MITRKEMRELIRPWEALCLGVASMKRDRDSVSFNGWKEMDFESAKARIREDLEMKGKTK